ncbi:hypothetical protein BHE74_00029276 [Ensete ventricosum]|nr:hypothetical protein BHE74_00029276 [Ensete ventricosum]
MKHAYPLHRASLPISSPPSSTTASNDPAIEARLHMLLPSIAVFGWNHRRRSRFRNPSRQPLPFLRLPRGPMTIMPEEVEGDEDGKGPGPTSSDYWFLTHNGRSSSGFTTGSAEMLLLPTSSGLVVRTKRKGGSFLSSGIWRGRKSWRRQSGIRKKIVGVKVHDVLKEKRRQQKHA